MIPSAVQHLEALRTSSMLTEAFRRMYRPKAAMVRPQKVIRILNEAGVRFVVMGTHGISGYRSEARATQDVDILVSKGDHRKAIAAVRKAYPKLQVEDTAVVTRFIDPATGKVVIDLMKPVFRLYILTFKNSVAVTAYRIPNLEMALVAKYAAMISPNRAPDKKHLDAGDFINIVRHNRDAIDLTKLERLAEVVYPGGAREIAEYVEDAKAGRTIKI